MIYDQLMSHSMVNMHRICLSSLCVHAKNKENMYPYWHPYSIHILQFYTSKIQEKCILHIGSNMPYSKLCPQLVKFKIFDYIDLEYVILSTSNKKVPLSKLGASFTSTCFDPCRSNFSTPLFKGGQYQRP